MPISKHLSELNALWQEIQPSQHRGLVLLAGDQDWCHKFTDELVDQLPFQHATLLGARPIKGIAVLPTSSATQLLGQECDLLIFDAHEGLNPNDLGAASGLVCGGGLMLLLVPSFEDFRVNADADYQRMCATEDQLARCSLHFHSRVLDVLSDCQNSIIIEQYTLAQDAPGEVVDILASAPDRHNETSCALTLTSGQKLAIDAILRVAQGHRNRPLVLTANRGRGKSSALGIAAARLISDKAERRILITAPSPASVKAALLHFENSLGNNVLREEEAGLCFVAPDELLIKRPMADLLLVDEAAGIPVPILEKLLVQYPRIVFSSTIHGYEGAGQGFSVRFRGLLDRLRPQWRELEITQPVRWGAGDPLEHSINTLLCLDSEYPEKLPENGELELRWLDQAELAEDKGLLNQAMALLTHAHYQTSPSDLRMLLDHPDVRLLFGSRAGVVHGLVLAMIEAPECKEVLTDEIVSNRRRLKGYLVPQTLASTYQRPSLLKLKGLRVVRIACHPKIRKQGLGSKLIKSCAELAERNALDYLSVSYGLTPELYNFWQNQGFQHLKLGYKKDHASGVNAIVGIKTLSTKAQTEFVGLEQIYSEHLLFGLNRYFRDLNWREVLTVLQSVRFDPHCGNAHNEKLIRNFAGGLLLENDCQLALFNFVCEKSRLHELSKLTDRQKGLIVLRVMQSRDWKDCCAALELSGKKEGVRLLRTTVAALLESQSD